jgi:putative ABC transport system permease protein
VLITDRVWRRRFSADPNTIGKTLRFSPRASYSIVGVMPASFEFPDSDVDLWSPSPPDAPFAQSRQATWFMAIGRLKPGVTLAEARTNLASVQSHLGQQYPRTDAIISTRIEPLMEATVGDIKRSLWLLFAAVSVLLLIACSNIAALLLSRASVRRHEISVRLSVGASRAAVAAQLFTEVLVLSVAGALLGLLVAAGASQVFGALAKNLPRVDEIRLHGGIVAYSLGCAVVVALLSGILPALRGTRQDLSAPLAHAGRTQVAGRNPLQFALVGVQVALAVTLLTAAGLLTRSSMSSDAWLPASILLKCSRSISAPHGAKQPIRHAPDSGRKRYCKASVRFLKSKPPRLQRTFQVCRAITRSS